MPADCTQGCWAPPLCCASYGEASADRCRVTSQLLGYDLVPLHLQNPERHHGKIQEYVKDFPLGLRYMSLITSH